MIRKLFSERALALLLWTVSKMITEFKQNGKNLKDEPCNGFQFKKLAKTLKTIEIVHGIEMFQGILIKSK